MKKITIEERMEVISEMEKAEELLRELDIKETLRMEWEQREESARRRKAERERHTIHFEGFDIFDEHIDRYIAMTI